jgi:hypothetical protein
MKMVNARTLQVFRSAGLFNSHAAIRNIIIQLKGDRKKEMIAEASSCIDETVYFEIRLIWIKIKETSEIRPNACLYVFNEKLVNISSCQ